MVTELPKIEHKGIEYIFDEKLCELRTAGGIEKPISFIQLRPAQCELLAYALGAKDKKLIGLNMDEIMERD